MSKDLVRAFTLIFCVKNEYNENIVSAPSVR